MKIVAKFVNLMLRFESLKLDLYNQSYGPFSGTATGCPVLVEPTIHIFGTNFRLGKVRIWTSILQGNCSSILEIDVRLLNHQNQTSITQIMVCFQDCDSLVCLMVCV